MPALFNTQQNNLPDFLETISPEDLHHCCDSKIYHRGREYFESGSVEGASYNIGKTRLRIVVQGRADYSVTIDLQNGEVMGSCTCPYGGVCKHIVASLFFALGDCSEIEVLPEAKSSGAGADRHLRSLSKGELIELVQKFAPDHYWVEVRNRSLDSSSARDTFKRVERAIQKLFKDSDLLYSIGDFDAALNKGLRKLRGLEPQLKEEIEGLLLYFMSEVGHAFDEGYLYDDYGDSCYEPSEEFDEFVAHYVTSLNYEEKVAFLSRLDAVLDEQSYDTFDSLRRLSETVFTEEDLPALKEMLVRDYKKLPPSLIENYYERVRPILTFQEKETVLTEIQNNHSSWILELVRLYDSQDQTMQAINTIKRWLIRNSGLGVEEVYMLYLDLLAKASLDVSEVAQKAISHCATCSMLQKIAALTDENLPDYELIMERNNAGQLLEYLESSHRLPEALVLIQRSKDIDPFQELDFFKRHKKKFPSEAEKFFCEEIRRNMEPAGDRYYHAIADMIHQLKQVNQSLAGEYLKDIRTNYKRRRNLISILSKL